ncbi:MAG: hypothetical protein HGA97_05495, partial [Chlorobiaceae bacterium]|nr:hypothetical protein [Chlorobiaceae bacterium]
MREPMFTPQRRLVAAIVLFFTASTPAPLHAYDSIEELLDRAESQGNTEELFSVLEELRSRPVPVNSATEEQLLELPLLTPIEAARIIDWRRLHGPISSGSELAAIIGEESAGRLSPFLSFRVPRASVKKETQGGFEGSVIERVSWDSPPRTGILNGKYAGDNRHLYSRVQASTPGYGVSLLQESDIGERDIDDFLSFSIHAQKIGVLTQAVVGNYRLSFGQGLLFGQGRYFSKGSDAIDGVQLFAPALRPYTAAAETGFLQGSAVTLSPGAFEFTAFSSSEKLDATITDGVVTGFSDTGYHRSTSEIAKKDNLSQSVNGLNLRYRYRSGELNAGIGATLISWQYGLPLEGLDGGRRGSSNGSVEAGVVYRQVQLFSEAAFSRYPDALSWIGGVQADLAKGISGVISIRNYAVDYYSPFAGAFAEKGDGGSNEQGYYIGLKAKALTNLTLAGSYDIFRFSELDREDYPLPSSGHDARLYAT